MTYPPTVHAFEAAATPKRERTRLAKSELWMALAATAERWSAEVGGREGRPYDEWTEAERRADPMLDIARRYGLSTDDLSRILHRMGDELENRALRSGYEDAWVDSAARSPQGEAGA